jgi:hypothetical protein
MGLLPGPARAQWLLSQDVTALIHFRDYGKGLDVLKNAPEPSPGVLHAKAISVMPGSLFRNVSAETKATGNGDSIIRTFGKFGNRLRSDFPAG